METDKEGRFYIETMFPGRYLDAGGYRPAHIHFKIAPVSNKYDPLTTQLYFQHGKCQVSDYAPFFFVFCTYFGTYCKLGLLIQYSTIPCNEGDQAGIVHGPRGYPLPQPSATPPPPNIPKF